METASTCPFRLIALLSVVLLLCPQLAFSQQPENPIDCQGLEPIPMSYGEHGVCDISQAVDIDIFSFDAAADDTVRLIVLSRTLGLDVRVELRDPGGTVLVDTFCDGGVAGQPSESLCSVTVEETLLQAGTYLIAVSEDGANLTGDYTLQLERIIPALNPLQLPYDFDITDTINPATDVDFLAFEGLASTSIRLRVSSDALGFDPRLELRDPSGTVLIDTFCDGGVAGSGGEDRCSLSEELTLATSGTYVLALSDQDSNESGGYDLTLECRSGDCDGGNQPPIIVVTGVTSVAQDDQITFEVTATDPDGDGVTLSSVLTNWCTTSNDLDAALDVDRRNVMCMPDGSIAPGSYSATFIAIDDGQATLSTMREVEITVLGGGVGTAKIIFVTSTTHTGDLGGLAGADAICQGLADSALLSGTYKAILSDSTTNAIDRLSIIAPNVEIKNTNGDVVTMGNAALWDGENLPTPTRYDENGSIDDIDFDDGELPTELPTDRTWTGTDAIGNTHPDNCTDWTDATSAVEGRYGRTGLVISPQWVSAASRRCDDEHHLFCITQ